jgi:hypothetical protein
MRSRAERMSLIRAGLLVGLLGCAAALPIGCSDDGGLDAAGFDGGSGGVGGVATGPCETGETRKCGIKLAQHDDIVTCYLGTQSCNAGTWGECTDGSQVTKSVVAPPGVGPGSGSMNFLGNCANNPCDPYCQNYNNDAGYNTEGGAPIYTWQGGQITGLPNGLKKKGLVEPCSDGADCQFNTYCWHPKTNAACGHSKCTTGGKLNWACDPCVNQVCKADQSCCTYPDTVPNGGSCAHDLCTAGAKLAKDCDEDGADCVEKICDSGLPGLDDCCKASGSWGAACVAAVTSVCGLSCPLSPAGTWTAGCVAKVASTCGAVCDTVAPIDEEGKCKEWIPGETNPSCAGVDLAVDVPCSNNIPVCNHGTVAAPAGIRLVHYPANSNQYPKCDPDQGHPQMYECFTTKPIPPGECTTDLQYWDGSAWKAGCDQLVGNREIMVNPQVQSGDPTPAGYAGYVNECSCKDNWSLYSGGSCGLPVCGGDVQVSTFKKTNYLIMIDRSGSMVSSGLWNPTVTGMTAFYQAAGNAGLGIAQEFYPMKSGGALGDGCAMGGATQCNSPATPCSNPMTPLGLLTAAAAPADAQEQALIAAFGSVHPSNGTPGTGQGTPTYPALEGALIWAMAQATAKPTEQFDVILITDGPPSHCNLTSAGAAALAANALATKGVRTYTLGLPGASTPYVNAIAAGGGTSSSITITSAATLAAELQAALAVITGAGVTCASDLPAANLFDQSDVTVTFTPSSGAPVNLAKKTDLAACGAAMGWYYDSNVTPTQLLLCPTSCTTAKNDAGSQIDFTLGCPKGSGPMTVTLDHHGQCPPGSKPTWNFFSYDTSTPATSTVTFRLRTADTQAGLGAASWHNLAVAQSTPTNTQVCPLTGPAPCPVDAFTALGFPDQKREWAQLEMALTPAGGGSPVVNGFNLTYSCPPSE